MNTSTVLALSLILFSCSGQAESCHKIVRVKPCTPVAGGLLTISQARTVVELDNGRHVQLNTCSVEPGDTVLCGGWVGRECSPAYEWRGVRDQKNPCDSE